MADARTDDDTYEPSHVDANRARQQGGGVGQKDLDAQRDPTGDRSADQYSGKSDSELGDRSAQDKGSKTQQGKMGQGTQKNRNLSR